MKAPWRRSQAPEARSEPISFSEWMSYFQYNGLTYPAIGQQTLGNKVEEPAPTFAGYVQGLLKQNPIIWTLVRDRAAVFSEARFTFRDRRTGKLFGTQALRALEEPAPGQSTAHLLTRALMDVDISGNAYLTRRNGRFYRLRPDWMTIIIGSKVGSEEYPAWQWDAEVIGYVYSPGGYRSGLGKVETFLPEEIAHFAPTPDPIAAFRGMSWITSVIRDSMADALATEHKIRYLEEGGTPNLAVNLGGSNITEDNFHEYVEEFKSAHDGIANAYKAFYMTGGTDIQVVGNSLKDSDLKAIQAATENRMSAAAGVPPQIAGFSEGLDASTYSNMDQAKRILTDKTIWPLWRQMAGAMESLVEVPGGAELWVDVSEVAFLQEEAKVKSEVFKADALAVKALAEVGYQHDTIVEAVQHQDLSKLEPTGTLVSHNLILNPELRLDPKYAGLFSEAPNAAASEEATSAEGESTDEPDESADAEGTEPPDEATD